MGFIKTFILGAAVAYGIQHITKKRADGSSILTDFMDNPPDIMNEAKEFASDVMVQVTDDLKAKIS